MMRSLLSRKTRLAVLTALVVLLTGGIAFAYWTIYGGAGTGSAMTGTTGSVVVHQTESSMALVPDGSTTLSGNFDNPGDSPAYVTSVSAAIGAFTHQPDETLPACDPSDFELTVDHVTVGQDIPAVSSGTGSWTGIVLHMINKTSNQDNCKGFAVPIVYTAH